MKPQTAIKNLKEILGDLDDDGDFLTSELWEIRQYSKAIYEKTSEILNERTF